MSRAAGQVRVAPDELQVLLLKAATGDNEQAPAAWAEARKTIRAIPELDGDTYRLLPLLYRNLSEQGVEDSALQQLKGVYRHSWYANHLLFHQAGALINTLEQAGVDTLVLKGGAITSLYYDAPGTRPMEDVDVLVRERQARRAIEVLDQGGWRLNFAAPTPVDAPIESILRTHHSVEYAHPRGQKLDLHWSPFWQPVDENPFWDDAIPLEIGGAQTRALCPEDQLLHLCVHGVSWSMRTPYWAADAVMLVRARDGQIDWEKLMERARSHELSVVLEHGLRFLREDLALDVPGEVIDSLAASPGSRAERRALESAFRSAHHGNEYRRSWHRYRRQAALEGRRASLGGFATYVSHSWGLANRRQLAGRLLKKAGQFLRHGVSHPTGAGEPPGR
jgi:hypothetical protein